jgi:diphthine synthase
MLWFVGLGLSGFNSISIETKNLLETADYVYLEHFTSPIHKTEINNIKKLVKGQFKITKRWMVEDGKEILKNARKKNVILLAYGDPYIATTHIELRSRAILEKIKTGTIHSASAITSMVGECGLHYYKIGKIVTIMNEFQTIKTAYYLLYENLIAGIHTVFLLEYNQDKKYFLNPKKAFSYLLKTEQEQQRKIISPSTFSIVASRIGSKNQKILAGKISSLKNKDFGNPPHTIIIPGHFHFTESDALKLMAKCLDAPSDNSSKIKKISKQMLEKYVPMVKKALEEISPYYKNSKEFHSVLENAELYIEDAEKFLEEGRDEVAILSIGYADGLVDALRISKGFEPKI